MAQEESADTAEPATLEINLDARGGASAALRIPGRSMAAPLAPVIGQVVGCTFQDPEDRDTDGGWVFSSNCEGAFRKRGLLVGGQLAFAPLMEVLKQADVERIEVTIRHPRTGFSRFTDNGWSLETTPQSLEYTKTLTPGASPRVRLAFGFRVINFLPISLLLLPIGLAMVMRWAALRARNTSPVVVWFTYWRLFGWMLTGAWLLWMQGSTVIDCGSLARFLLNDSPYAPLLQAAFYLVPPVLVQLICTVTAGAVLARATGEHWVLPVSLKHAFWHEPVTVWPLLCLLVGVVSLTVFDEVILGLVCLAVAYTGRGLLVWLWLRLEDLGRNQLTGGGLRAGILQLAQKSGVQLKEIYLLPAADGRLASPYMIRGRRLLLSETMLRGLEKRETEAILAREFAHMRRHHRDILLGTAILALPLIYRFAHLSFVADTIPWGVRGPLLVWLAPLFLYMLWRRLERAAEAEALKVTGDREALSRAIVKIAQCNVIGYYWRRFEWRFFPNGAAGDGQQPVRVLPAGGKQVLVTADSGGSGGAGRG